MESLPRTEQSLGTPQQHAIRVSKPRDLRTATTPNVSAVELARSGSPLGPPAVGVEPGGTGAESTGGGSVSGERLSGGSERSAGGTQLAASLGAAADRAEPVMREAVARVRGGGGADLSGMKVAPRELIASLEDYVPLEAEKLIGRDDVVDLIGDELEPTVDLSEHALAAADAVREAGGEAREAARDRDGEGAEESDAERRAALENLVVAEPIEDPSEEPAAAGAAVPAHGAPISSGMSPFERFALNAIAACESHLRSVSAGDTPEIIPVSTGGAGGRPPTQPVKPQAASAAGAAAAGSDAPERAGEDLAPADVVELVENTIPPATVSPGLDEMVISSTSQTDFDLNDSEMVFVGNVQVRSPRFNMRADKFIVHLKKDSSGMSFGEALGNVVIDLREDGRETGYSGLAGKAIYDPVEGKITLTDWPKIRQQFKEHVAVTRDTKMVLFTDGRVKTMGRNRTVIRR